jgi:hypothetical protein
MTRERKPVGFLGGIGEEMTGMIGFLCGLTASAKLHLAAQGGLALETGMCLVPLRLTAFEKYWAATLIACQG